MILLNRWHSPDAEGACLDSIEVNQTVWYQQCEYQLQGAVVHLGPSPDSGHYVAIARHQQGREEWWIYDDADRRIATPEQVSTLENPYKGYAGYGNMQSYIVVYELVHVKLHLGTLRNGAEFWRCEEEFRAHKYI